MDLPLIAEEERVPGEHNVDIPRFVNSLLWKTSVVETLRPEHLHVAADQLLWPLLAYFGEEALESPGQLPIHFTMEEESFRFHVQLAIRALTAQGTFYHPALIAVLHHLLPSFESNETLAWKYYQSLQARQCPNPDCPSNGKVWRDRLLWQFCVSHEKVLWLKANIARLRHELAIAQLDVVSSEQLEGSPADSGVGHQEVQQKDDDDEDLVPWVEDHEMEWEE